MDCSHSSQDESLPGEHLWQSANADIAVLQTIISTHFHARCRGFKPLNSGSFARVFLFSLENNIQVVGRVVLPVRESFKTEAEVAAMELVRARTKIPVPQVYLYCSTPHNPVRAEWILMEYMPGRTLWDCFETLTLRQKLRAATDLANILSSLFRITASQCGSIASVSRDAGCLWRLRFQDSSLSSVFSRLHFLIDDQTVVGPVNIGPINDVTFLDYPNQIPPQFCGPFDSERQLLQAIAFLGQPPTRKGGKLGYWAFEKAIEVYDAIKQIQEPPSKRRIFLEERETFHFAHGDLSDQNILINPDTGEITGVIDWEIAGFRPPCLAAVTGGWLNDDSERFLMSEHQDARGDYKDDTPTDAVVRAKFRLQLAAMHENLYRHYLQGVELRAIFYTCCNEFPANTEGWLEKYKDLEWSTERRGPFPFDYMAWWWEKNELWNKEKENGEPL